jgi:hypothetical protein
VDCALTLFRQQQSLKQTEQSKATVMSERFNHISDKLNFAQEEENILAFWNEIDAFKLTLKLSEGRPEYTFYDGPPFATGLPHYGFVFLPLLLLLLLSSLSVCLSDIFLLEPSKILSQDMLIKLDIMFLVDLVGIVMVSLLSMRSTRLLVSLTEIKFFKWVLINITLSVVVSSKDIPKSGRRLSRG